MSPAALLLELRLMHMRNAWHLLRTHSRTRAAAIIVSCTVTWGSLFVFSMYAFHELKTRYNFPLNGMFQELLFDVMFFALSSLLLFSCAILLYTGLFSSQESRFLLTTPLPDDHIFAYKFQGALAFSNWGFLLLGSPILIAYGLSVEGGAPWTFFLALPLFFLGFVLIPGSVGAIVCLLLVNFLPRNWTQLFKIIAIGLTLVALVWAYRMMRAHSSGFQPSRVWIEGFINQLTLLSGGLQPHHWVAAGLRAAATRETSRVWYYLGLVWSNGLLFYVIAIWLGRRLYRRGVERVIAGGSLLGNRVRSFWLDRWIERSLFFVDLPTRLFVVKDFRTFRRDPAQWLQIFIFVGLMLFYFWGMRSFFDRNIDPRFKNGISFLMVTATGLLMCAYTGRFIYPLLSLEGRTFWLLGLLPLNRARLIWGKFAFAAFTCLLPCTTLIVVCDLILGSSVSLFLMHLATIALLAIGLSGLSVSMGTLMPNFRETDPSKIAVGFGGTMNLVIGFFYLLIVVVLVSLPLHITLASLEPHEPIPWIVWLLAGLGGVFAVVSTGWSLRAAARCLERMEF